MTHAMMKNTNLMKVFWGEAISTAVYLLNRAPTKSLEGKTPYEGLTGRQPPVEHLKVFGFIVFVKTLGESLRKLDDRSIPMISIGYEKGVKGYRTFKPISQTIQRCCFPRREKLELGRIQSRLTCRYAYLRVLVLCQLGLQQFGEAHCELLTRLDQ